MSPFPLRMSPFPAKGFWSSLQVQLIRRDRCCECCPPGALNVRLDTANSTLTGTMETCRHHGRQHLTFIGTSFPRCPRLKGRAYTCRRPGKGLLHVTRCRGLDSNEASQ